MSRRKPGISRAHYMVMQIYVGIGWRTSFAGEGLCYVTAMRCFPLFFGLVCAAALAVSGCAGNDGQARLFGSPAARPKVVVVADFIAASEVTATDNGFNTRLERRGGNYPILERRQRTLARVNDEIVATIVADVRAAGIEAQPGGEASLGFGDNAVLVSGRLHPPEHKPAAQIGFGPGRGNIVAEMTLTHYAGGGKAPLLSFSADVQAGRKLPAGNAQAVAARDTAIAAALAAENALPEKLSPDVEAQARSLGRAIAAKIVAYGKEHNWLEKPETAETSAAQQQVKLPEPEPAPKPVAMKPAAAKSAAKKPKDPLAPEDEEPPDTNVPDQDKQ